MLIGTAVSGWLLVGREWSTALLSTYTRFCMLRSRIVIGYQTVIFAIFTKVFAITEGLLA
jgi:hypothetical protein